MELLNKIYMAGVVGAGGAGFPTHKKLVKGVKWLIINAAECEPLLQTDIYITRANATQIIETLDYLKKELEIENVVVGIKAKHNEEIQLLNSIIKEQGSPVTLHLLPNVYPMGDEQVLVYEVTGEVVPPGGIPLAVSTVVQNVTTILNIHEALKDIPVTKKVVTMVGEINEPCLLEVAIGTSVSECISAAGGGTLSDYVCLLGGPMMGIIITKTEAESSYITKTSSSIILLPKDHYLSTFDSVEISTIHRRASAACIQCTYCTDMCPRFLLGHQIRPHRVMRSIATKVDTTDLTDALLCCECGICELYACPMGLSPRKVNVSIKAKLREKGIGSPDKTIYNDYQKMRPYRQIPQERLLHRLNLNSYLKTDLEIIKHTSKTVSIPLKQGIGKPAVPVVSVGDNVAVGDLIGKLDFEDTGAQVHASIAGKVTSVSSNIVITA